MTATHAGAGPRARRPQAWERAVTLNPLDFDTLFNLGIVLAESPEPREALPYLKRFATDTPPERY